MKRIIGILILLGIIAIIVVQLAINKTIAENRVYNYDKENEIPVFAEVIDGENQPIDKSFSGSFEALNEVKVSSETQGLIETVFVKEGDQVKKGDALIKVNDEMLLLNLEVLNTKIEGLEKDEERFIKLKEKEAIPGINLEKTQNALKTLRAEKQSVLEKINNTTIRAPFDAVVSMKFCEKGQFAAPSMPLLELVNTNQLKFVIHVSELEINSFNEQLDYRVYSDAVGGEPIDVQLLQISDKGGFGNNFKIEFLVAQELVNAKPKMFGTLKFQTDFNNKKVIQIPSKSILGSQSNPEVYLIKNGRAKRTSIIISSRNGNTLNVKEGIQIGDTLITGGFINVFDNANVLMKE